MFEDKYSRSARDSFFYRLIKSRVFVLGLIAGIVIGGGAFSAYSVISIGTDLYPEKTTGEIIESFGQLIIAGDRPLARENSGEINILFLGVGGNGYYGNMLTDTIIIASLRLQEDPQDTEVVLLSVPRDLWVEVPGVPGSRKINEAFLYGELREEEKGYLLLGEVLEEWTGIRLDYYVVGNFDAFQAVVDIVGGVEVEVERAFTDYSYPDSNGGFLSPVSFDIGLQHMDGGRALQFARSRKGTNGEGSDFARSKRQQKILVAFKEKLSALNYLIDISTISKIASSLSGNFEMNLELWETRRLYDLLKSVPNKNFRTVNFDPRTTGMLCSGIDEETQLYAIKLCAENTFGDLHEFVENRFEFEK